MTGSRTPGSTADLEQSRKAVPSSGRQRFTRQAAAVEDALSDADGFRTAQDLFAQIRATGDRVGLATVYRHLGQLVETGRADVVRTADGEAQYRLCGTPGSVGATGDTTHDGHHHHIVCRECGRSVEVGAPEIEQWAARVAAEAGFTDVTHTVEIFGVCAEHASR